MKHIVNSIRSVLPSFTIFSEQRQEGNGSNVYIEVGDDLHIADTINCKLSKRLNTLSYFIVIVLTNIID